MEDIDRLEGEVATVSHEAVRIDSWQGTARDRKLYRFVKRSLDIILSMLALIVLSPVFLVVAIAIKLDSPGPIIFKQTRAGKDGDPFTIYKFRTMCCDAEEKLVKMDVFKDQSAIDIKHRLKNDPRITKLGSFLRKTSIDELPQFANTLIGNMSLVGPRPLAMYEHEALNSYQRLRVTVKPGITCFWQVSGRSNLTEQERVELDLQYIREQGVGTDIALLAKTVPALLKKTGAY